MDGFAAFGRGAFAATAGGPRRALLVGSGACFAAAMLAGFVHTPPHPDQALTDLGH